MKKCKNTAIAIMMGRYEFDLLTPEEKKEFEDHLLNCDYCFRELYEFSPAVKTMNENLSQFRKAVTAKFSFYEKVKSYLPKFIPEPVKPAIPAIGLVIAAIIFVSIIWTVVKPSLIRNQQLTSNSQPAKIVLQDGEEMAHKGDMEKFTVVDSALVKLPEPATMKRLNQSMEIRPSVTGDSLIFCWRKFDDVKSYHISLINKNVTVFLTPAQGISDSIFVYAKKNLNLAQIINWELKAVLFNGSHFKTQKKFQLQQ